MALGVGVVAYRTVYHSLAAYYRMVPWIEDLLVPCTGRFGWVPDLTALRALPQWQAFIEQKIEYFPCSAIAGIPLVEVGISWQRQEYFHVALGTWFRIVGPKIDGFITFQSAMFAVTCAVAYLIFRLGMGRAVALACTAGLVWSRLHLWSAGLPIEYAKAPFILATVWLCGVVLRRDALGKPVWAPAMAAGLAGGVGIGFKADVLVAVPLAIFTILVFVRSGPVGSYRKTIATVCVIAGVAIGGGRIIHRDLVAPQGSLFAVQILGGQDWRTEALHAENPQYDYGLLFDDSHMTVLINNYGRRVLGTAESVWFFSREMQHISSRLLIDFWSTFPGDLVLRVIAATLRVLQLNGLGGWVAVAGLFVVFSSSVRVGWFVAAVTMFLSAFVSLVFQRRHIFHLEFISWWLTGALAQSVLLAHPAIRDPGIVRAACARLVRPVLTAALCMFAIVVFGALVLMAARWYQQSRMLGLVDRYISAPLGARPFTRALQAPDGAMLQIEGISLRDHEPAAAVNQVASDYLVVKFRCRDEWPIRVTATYWPPAANWDRPFAVPCAASGSESTLMVAVHQLAPTYLFKGLAMSAADADRVSFVATVRENPAVRLWLNLLIPADWRTRDWAATLKVPLQMPLD